MCAGHAHVGKRTAERNDSAPVFVRTRSVGPFDGVEGSRNRADGKSQRDPGVLERIVEPRSAATALSAHDCPQNRPFPRSERHKFLENHRFAAHTSGFLNRRSQVRLLPGAPFSIPPTASSYALRRVEVDSAPFSVLDPRSATESEPFPSTVRVDLRAFSAEPIRRDRRAPRERPCCSTATSPLRESGTREACGSPRLGMARPWIRSSPGFRRAFGEGGDIRA